MPGAQEPEEPAEAGRGLEGVEGEGPARPGWGRKASLVLATHGVGSVLGYLILLVIGRYFDPSAFGLYHFTVAALGLVAVFVDAGFGAAHVHFMARGVEPARALGVYWRIRLTLTVGAILLVLTGAWVWLVALGKPFTDATTLPIVLVVLAMQTTTSLRSLAFDSWIARGHVNRTESTRTLDTCLVLLLLAFFGLAQAAGSGRWTPTGPVADFFASLVPGAGSWTAAQAGLAIATAYLVAKVVALAPVAWWWVRDGLWPGAWDGALARRYARFALPLLLSGAAAAVLWQTDNVMIGYFLTSADVGHYGMAQKVANLGLVVANAVAIPLLPRFSALLEEGRTAEARATLQDAERALLLVGLPLAVALMTLTGPIVHVAIGDAYLPAVWPARVLAASMLVAILLVPTSNKVMGSGQSRPAMVATFVAVTVNFLLNLWLIPGQGAGLGTTGAAIATLVASLSGGIILRGALWRRFGIPLWTGAFTRMALAGVALGLFWWGALAWLGEAAFGRFWSLGALGVSGLAVFLGAAAALGMFRAADLRAVWRVASPSALLRELRGRR